MIVAGAVDVTVGLLSPCSLRYFGSREALKEGHCHGEFYIVYLVRTMISCLALLVSMVFLHRKVWTMFWSNREEGRSRLPSRDARTAYDRRYLPAKTRCCAGWVAAASPDMFNETACRFRAGNVLAGIVLLPYAALQLVVQANSMVENWDSHEFNREEKRGVSIDDVVLCELGYKTSVALLSFNASLVMTVNMAFFTQPVLLWSRHARLAQRKSQDRFMASMMSLPWLGPPAFLGLAVEMAVHIIAHISVEAQPALWTLLFVCGSGLAIYLVVVAFYTMMPQQVASVLYISSCNLSRRFFRRPRHDETSTSLLPQTSREVQATSQSGELTKHGLFATVKYSDIGVQQSRHLFVLIQLVLWSQRVLSAPMPEMIVVLLMRAGAMAALLLVSDRCSSFSELQESCSFGLVVDAWELRKAIKGSRTHDVHPLPMYKATLPRMQETLAISYRWQPEEVEIAPSCSLNMKPFQLEAIAQAISACKARYVWLDRLSVPQEHCSQKQALLARMMGVYVAAGWTVALRTNESPGSRYHQRAWTLQEFCCASRLQVVTEPPASSSSCTGDLAVQTGEDTQSLELRNKFQHARGFEVLPLWLRDESTTMTPDQAKEIMRQYRDLSGSLQCLMPGDMVRALLPLLARCPVETQCELVALVDMLGKCSGEDVHWLKAALFDRHLHNKGIHRRSTGSGIIAAVKSGNTFRTSPSSSKRTGSGSSVKGVSSSSDLSQKRDDNHDDMSSPAWRSSRPDLSQPEHGRVKRDYSLLPFNMHQILPLESLESLSDRFKLAFFNVEEDSTSQCNLTNDNNMLLPGQIRPDIPSEYPINIQGSIE